MHRDNTLFFVFTVNIRTSRIMVHINAVVFDSEFFFFCDAPEGRRGLAQW
jgi:hypothetical protein